MRIPSYHTGRALALLAATALTAGAVVSKAQTADPSAPPQGSTLFAPVGEWTRDSIFRPVAPFELVPGKNPDGWSLVVEPYLWTMSMRGDVGIKNIGPAGVQAATRKLLQNLDWGLMGRGELRHGRWGLLADGLYADLSGETKLGDVLYQSGTLDLEQGLASAALAYRVIDDRRGFVDVYAGARYNYLGMSLGLDRSTVGADALGQRIANGVASRINDRVTSAVAAAQSSITSAVNTATEEASIARSVIRALAPELGSVGPNISGPSLEKLAALQDLTQRGDRRDRSRGADRGVGRGPTDGNGLLPGGGRDPGLRPDRGPGVGPGIGRPGGQTNLPGLPGFAGPDRRVVEALTSGRLAGVLSSARGEIRSYVREAAAAKVAQARGTFGPAAQARFAAAQQRLASKVSQAVYNALPTGGSASRAWVDPIIGLRGQLNLTRWLFLAAQGDAGGFGVGSELTWVTQATVGFNLSRNVFLEGGYRYMYVDYDRDNFLYDMTTYGWFAGLGFKF